MKKSYSEATRRSTFNKERNIRIANFRKLLENHDWYYDKSDDRRKYEAGLQQEQEIKRLATGEYVLNQMYEAKKRKIFNPKK